MDEDDRRAFQEWLDTLLLQQSYIPWEGIASMAWEAALRWERADHDPAALRSQAD